MINKLTPEQKELLKKQYEMGLEIGRSIEPIDRKRVENCISKFYNKFGMKRPKFLFYDSPKACEEVINSMLGTESQIHNCFAGQQWCAWEISYDFCRQIGVKYTDEQNELLDIWIEQSWVCHWWWPFENAVIVSERPIVLNLDNEGRLHNATGPAIEYSDGWKLYFWHGVSVERDWIENPDSIDPNKCVTHENIEQRRALCEIVTWEKILEVLEVKVIDVDPDPQIGTLLSTHLPDHGEQRFLRVLEASTGRHFAIMAPRNVNTALDAQAEIAQLPKEIFKFGYVRT